MLDSLAEAVAARPSAARKRSNNADALLRKRCTRRAVAARRLDPARVTVGNFSRS